MHDNRHRQRRALLSIRLHLALHVLSYLAGMFVGSFLFLCYLQLVVWLPIDDTLHPGILSVVIVAVPFFGIIGGCIFLCGTMFPVLVAARCPECGGRAFQTGQSDPLTYKCRACSAMIPTSVSIGQG